MGALSETCVWSNAKNVKEIQSICATSLQTILSQENHTKLSTKKENEETLIEFEKNLLPLEKFENKSNCQSRAPKKLENIESESFM